MFSEGKSTYSSPQKRVFICTQLGFVHALYKRVYFFFSFSSFSRFFFFTFTNKTYKMWSHLKFHRILFLYIENHHYNKLLIHEMESGVWDGITCPGSLKYWWPGSDKKRIDMSRQDEHYKGAVDKDNLTQRDMKVNACQQKHFSRILHSHLYIASRPSPTPF